MEVILQIITGVVVTFLSAVVLRMQDEAKKGAAAARSGD